MVENILRCGLTLWLIGLFGSVGVHADPTSSRQAVPLAIVMSEGTQREPDRLFEDGNSCRHRRLLPLNQPTTRPNDFRANRIAATASGNVSSVSHLRETRALPLPDDRSSSERQVPVSSQNTPTRLPPAGSSLLSPGSSLPPKGESNSESRGNNGMFQMMATMGGALLLVIGLFLLLAWMMRRTSRRTGGLLPQGVVEVLGHQPLAGRQQVHLLRIGNRILLVSVMPDSIETLTEITDPAEVDRIAGVCRQSGSGSSTGAFQAVMRQFSQGSGQIADPPPTVDQLRRRLGT